MPVGGRVSNSDRYCLVVRTVVTLEPGLGSIRHAATYTGDAAVPPGAP